MTDAQIQMILNMIQLRVSELTRDQFDALAALRATTTHGLTGTFSDPRRYDVAISYRGRIENFIGAIKTIRTLNGNGLLETKKLVERIQAEADYVKHCILMGVSTEHSNEAYRLLHQFFNVTVTQVATS